MVARARSLTRAAAMWIAVGGGAVGSGCAGSGDAAPPIMPAPPTVIAPAPGEVGAFSPSGDRHPGQIVYEDRVERRTWTRDALDVPATMAWVLVRGRWRPVVLVEIEGSGRQREITTYGPDHELLEHTTARLAAPPPQIAPAPAPAASPRPPAPTPTDDPAPPPAPERADGRSAKPALPTPTAGDAVPATPP